MKTPPPQPPLSKPNPERAWFWRGCALLLVALIAFAVVLFVPVNSDGVGAICVGGHDQDLTHRGETRHHLLKRLGPDVPELWNSDRSRDYPTCGRWSTMRVVYRPHAWEIRRAFIITCPYHHAAECTRKRIA